MSNKISPVNLLKEHFNTLKNAQNDKVCISDLFCFIFLPCILGLLSGKFGYELNAEFRSALINFGAIFSALLMSVLVLVYDQDNKLSEKESNKKNSVVNYEAKKTLLGQLYHNICYAIFISLLIVSLSLIHIVLDNFNCRATINWLINPLLIFLVINMILTTLMIIKRMHALLRTVGNP